MENNSYHQPQLATPATAEELQLTVKPLSVFDQMFLAFRRAHYLQMLQNPRSEEHKRFIKRELKSIDKQQQLARGYTKKITL